ncbi:MAG TPA: ABC transporter permease [bacterium]|nr:ABC transporter permease [bacterium]
MPPHGRGPRDWPYVAAFCAALLMFGVALPRLVVGAAPQPDLPTVDLTDRSARLLGVQAGEVIEVGTTAAGPWQRLRVAHVYHPAEYPTEISRTRVDVRLHLADLEALEGGADDVDSVVVRLRASADPGQVATRLDVLPIGARAYSSRELAAHGSAPFEVIARFHEAISVVTVVTSSVFLLAIMTLRGEEMRRQVGVMRLVGISPRSVGAAILLIATGIAVAGSLVGVGLGYVLSAATNVAYQRLFDTTVVFSRITLPLLGEAVTLSVALGIAAGALTTWRLLRRRALEQLGR